MEKKELRKMFASRVAGMSFEEKKSESERISRMICESDGYASSDIVLSYMAMDSELDVRAVNESALRDGKSLFLPRTEKSGSAMDFYFISPDREMDVQLERGRWGIWEPSESCPKLDCGMTAGKKILAIVPGVGFSKGGKRLGHGMGFYDIYIEKLVSMAKENSSELILMGAAFPCQIDSAVDSVSLAHDAVMDVLVY